VRSSARAHPAPGPVKTVFQLDHRQAIQRDHPRVDPGRFGRALFVGNFFGHAQLDHQAAQELGFQFGVAGAGFPAGLLPSAWIDVFLGHAAVGDENLGAAAGIALQPGAVLVPQAGVVQAVKHLAQQTTNSILGDLGAVFRPLGFHDADLGLVNRSG